MWIFVCYWFEKAREQLEKGVTKRAGLIATNSIRGGRNRRVLERIKETGDITLAWPDRPWIQDGAAVRVSIVGFDKDNGEVKKLAKYASENEAQKQIKIRTVENINPDLTSGPDLALAKRLSENAGKSFEGAKPAGPFDVTKELAHSWLGLPNPSGVSNEDVLKPYVSGEDILGKSNNRWTVDFNRMPLEVAQK